MFVGRQTGSSPNCGQKHGFGGMPSHRQQIWRLPTGLHHLLWNSSLIFKKLLNFNFYQILFVVRLLWLVFNIEEFVLFRSWMLTRSVWELLMISAASSLRRDTSTLMRSKTLLMDSTQSKVFWMCFIFFNNVLFTHKKCHVDEKYLTFVYQVGKSAKCCWHQEGQIRQSTQAAAIPCWYYWDQGMHLSNN